MTEQLPSIHKSHAVDKPATRSESLLGRGLVAIEQNFKTAKKIYQVRRIECHNCSGIESWLEEGLFFDLDKARESAKKLFIKEYGSDKKFCPQFFYEILASDFGINIPEGWSEKNGFLLSLISNIDDVEKEIEEWWDLNFGVIHPYWEIVLIDDIEDDSGESVGFVTSDYCIENNRLFLYMNVIE